MKVIATKKNGDRIVVEDARPIRYEGVFIIIVDHHGDQTIVPAVDIDEVKTFDTERPRW